MNSIFDYTFLIGITLFVIGLFYLLYMLLKMSYEAIKEKEPVFVCVGLLGSGFIMIILSVILNAFMESIH